MRVWYNCTQKIAGQVYLDAPATSADAEVLVIVYSGKHKNCEYSETRGETE